MTSVEHWDVEGAPVNVIDCGECVLPVVSNVIVIEATCGNSDGQATIVTAGTGNYNYTWSPSVSSF